MTLGFGEIPTKGAAKYITVVQGFFRMVFAQHFYGVVGESIIVLRICIALASDCLPLLWDATSQ